MSTYLIFFIVVTFIWAAYIVITVAVDVNKKKGKSGNSEEIIDVNMDDNDDSRYVSETDSGFSITNKELSVDEDVNGSDINIEDPVGGGGSSVVEEPDAGEELEDYLSESSPEDEEPDDGEDEIDYQIYQLKSECEQAEPVMQDSYLSSDFVIALSKPINNSTKIFCQLTKI